jgi:three-Cys-motif partner protein
MYQFEGPDYYTRGIHQKLKHKFIETYLDIWVENVGGSGKVVPTVDFFDLFAATGKARSEETGETWDGSAIIVARALAKYPRGNLLFLNSYNPDVNVSKIQFDILKREIKSVVNDNPQFEKVKRVVISEKIEDAVEIALNNLNRNFPSVWVLDPEHPSDLPWNVIQKIASAVGNPYGPKGERKKPELIINLMTSTLQRTINTAPQIFTEAIGLPEEEWRAMYSKYETKWKKKGIEDCTRHVILDIYGERLSSLYEKLPVMSLIPSKHGNIVYSMILCTDSNAGYYMMQKNLKTFEKYKIFEWKQEVMKIQDPDQSFLSDFTKS